MAKVIESETTGASRGTLRPVRLSNAPIQIVAIYLIVSLLIPWLLIISTDLWPIFYRYDNFRLAEAIAVFGAVGFACLLCHLRWANRRNLMIEDRQIAFVSSQKTRIVFLIATIIFAVIGVISGNSGWRYSDVSLSEQSSFALYFYTVIPEMVRLLLIFHAFIYRGEALIDKIERWLVTGALATSINGNATAFVAAFSFLMLQLNGRNYLFKQQIGLGGILRFVGLVAGLLLVLLLAYMIGEAVKRGDDLANILDWFSGTAQGSVWSPEIVVERASPSYVSLVNALPLTFETDRASWSNLMGVLNNFLFRMDALGITSFGIDRGSAESMMRHNYEWIDIFAASDREGTSPGLIPGFIYCFPPGLNVLMLCMYSCIVLTMLQRLCLCMSGPLSLTGKLVLSYMVLPLFESPVDILMIIDDGFISFMGLWWIGRLVRQVPVRLTVRPSLRKGLGSASLPAVL